MKPLLLSTPAYQYLLDEVLATNDWENGSVEVKIFPDGEVYHRLLTHVEGRAVFLIGGTINDSATLALFDLAQGLVQYGAYALHIIIPYFGYSTMERSVLPGEIVKAKTRALLFSSLPATPLGNTVVLLDVHSEGIPYYFNASVRPVHLYAKSLIQQLLKDLNRDNLVLAATDAGRAKWVESLANDLHVTSAFVYKKRSSGNSTLITGVNAPVEGKHVYIYDDMIRTGGSLIQAAKAYHDAGAISVSAITTHGVFTEGAFEKIAKSALLEKLYSFDTHPNVLNIQHPLLEKRTVAPLITDYIRHACKH